MVKGHTIFAVSLGKDLSALMRLIPGGELIEYTDMMGEARDLAVNRMLADAEKLGADTVINVRFVTNSVVTGAAELLAYGTAVKLKKQNINKEGKTVFLSSPILEEVEKLCDRVSIIRQGEIIESGTLQELRHLTRTRILVEIKKGIPSLDEVKGVHDIQKNNNTLSFQVDTEEINNVIQYLSQFRDNVDSFDNINCCCSAADVCRYYGLQ